MVKYGARVSQGGQNISHRVVEDYFQKNGNFLTVLLVFFCFAIHNVFLAKQKQILIHNNRLININYLTKIEDI